MSISYKNKVKMFYYYFFSVLEIKTFCLTDI